jgi:hypothetical protein
LQSIDYQARAEATKYENRQLALKSVAATTADASVAAAPAAPVTGTISILASGAALIDQAVTTGHVDIVDGILSAVPAFRLAKTAAALTGIAEVGQTVKAGEEALHVGHTVLGDSAQEQRC